MRKRSILFLLIFIFLLFGIFSVGVFAEHEEGHVDGIDERAELQTEAGLTPDSAFYFIDEFFDRFGSDLENREEKIAEIRAMVEQGKFEEARRALEGYREHAETFEREVNPDEREEALRSSDAIKNAISDLEGEIPDDEREEFVDDVIDREGKIETAVEIASKIKELCVSLSEIDPLEYSRVCGVNEDSPRWQRNLHEDLTDEQKKEAEEFYGIMSQCFKNPGECRCDDISVSAFAAKCGVVAPLAVQCNEGDENACDVVDSETDEIFDLLPNYLQDVLDKVERDFGDDKFDNHAPRECVDAGVRDREGCFQIMFRLNAPRECVDALDNGEISVRSERGAREQCEKIMFQRNAPEECINAGLADHRECGKLMFQRNAPEECINAGLTGESQRDRDECEKIARDSFEDDGERHGGGASCRVIEDAEERLACYDGVASGLGDKKEHSRFPAPCQEAGALTRESCESVMHEWGEQQREDSERRYEETRELEKECAQSCSARGGAWDFSGGECNCRIDGEEGRFEDHRDFDQGQEGNFDEGDFDQGQEGNFDEGDFDQGQEGNFDEGDFDQGQEGNFDEGDFDQGQEGNFDEGDFDQGQEGNFDDSGSSDGGSSGDSGSGDSGSSDGSFSGSSDSGSSGGESGSDGGSSGDSGSSDSGGSSSGSSDSGGSSSGSSDSGGSSSGGGSSGGGDSGGGFTGGVIFDFEGNGFLDYFFR